MDTLLQIAPKPGSLEVFAVSEAGHAASKAVVRHLGAVPEIAFHSGTLATAARLAGIATFAETVLLEIEEGRLADHVEALRALAEGGVSPVLLGPPCDVSTYRKLVAAGALDYLELPLSEGVDLSFLRRSTPAAPVLSTSKGRVIAVSGVCGGVGASVLAGNLAAAFAGDAMRATSAQKAALIDADLLFGTLAVDFGVEQTRGYLDALEDPSRVDMTYLDATIAEPLAGLALYSAEVADGTALPQLNAGLPALLAAFGDNFATTIVDLPRGLLLDGPRTLLDHVDDLILVQAPGFGAVRTLGRLVAAIGLRGNGPRIHVVLSRARQDAQLTAAEIVEAVAQPVVAELPYAMRDIARGHIKGAPVINTAAQSRYGKAVLALKAHLEQVASPKSIKPRKGLFGQLFA